MTKLDIKFIYIKKLTDIFTQNFVRRLKTHKQNQFNFIKEEDCRPFLSTAILSRWETTSYVEENMKNQLIAHVIFSENGNRRIQTLEEHCRNAARLCAEACSPIGLENLGYLSGRNALAVGSMPHRGNSSALNRSDSGHCYRLPPQRALRLHCAGRIGALAGTDVFFPGTTYV